MTLKEYRGLSKDLKEFTQIELLEKILKELKKLNKK